MIWSWVEAIALQQKVKWSGSANFMRWEENTPNFIKSPLNLALNYSIFVFPWMCFHVVLFRAANVVQVIGISVFTLFAYESELSKGWWNSVVSFDQILLRDPFYTRLDSFVRNLERRMDGMLFWRSRSEDLRLGFLWEACMMIWSPQVRHQMVWNDKY